MVWHDEFLEAGCRNLWTWPERKKRIEDEKLPESDPGSPEPSDMPERGSDELLKITPWKEARKAFQQKYVRYYLGKNNQNRKATSKEIDLTTQQIGNVLRGVSAKKGVDS